MPVLLEIIGEAGQAKRIARELDGAGPFQARACDPHSPVPVGEASPDFLLFLRDRGQGMTLVAGKEKL